MFKYNIGKLADEFLNLSWFKHKQAEEESELLESSVTLYGEQSKLTLDKHGHYKRPFLG